MTADAVDPFPDVHELLERSYPQSRPGLFWYFAGFFLLVVMLSTYLGFEYPAIVNLISAFSLVALVVTMSVLTMFVARRVRRDQEQIQMAFELVQLRRWPEAARLLQNILSRPTRSMQMRVQALVYYISVLARYGRFADAITVEDHLLENGKFDPGTDFGLRVGRAMALLREDRLFDADRAISELRRVNVPETSGLALVEIYRDVKTGHPAEAIAIFQEHLPAIKKQLGHRSADTHALIAKAHELLKDPIAAAAAWRDATTLAPAVELIRRYPQLSTIAEKYPAAPAPAPSEAA